MCAWFEWTRRPLLSSYMHHDKKKQQQKKIFEIVAWLSDRLSLCQFCRSEDRRASHLVFFGVLLSGCY